jgi:hypothetical protein
MYLSLKKGWGYYLNKKKIQNFNVFPSLSLSEEKNGCFFFVLNLDPKQGIIMGLR